MNKVEVEIQYFKPSGKYYTSGSFSVDKTINVFEASEIFKKTLKNGIMPGLSGFESNFLIYISFKELDNGYPVILKAKDFQPNISLRDAAIIFLNKLQKNNFKTEEEFIITFYINNNNIEKILNERPNMNNLLSYYNIKNNLYHSFVFETEEELNNKFNRLFDIPVTFKKLNIDCDNFIGNIKLKNSEEETISFTSIGL